MNHPPVVPRADWVGARRRLLAREKEATRRQDALAAERRNLPMVKITKEYRFEGPGGSLTLPDLFTGHRQLIIYHFMFDHGWDEGCPICSYCADSLAGAVIHLAARDTAFAAISRAPLAKIEAFRQRMGWTFPWYSSRHSDFNYDFGVTLEHAASAAEYNYAPTSARGEMPGLSVFLREGDSVFHTYSTYARGLDALLGTYTLLDLTPLGRHEDHEPSPMTWIRHHDNYPG